MQIVASLWQVQVLLFGTFWNSFQVFLICNWLNSQMQSTRIWRANYFFLSLFLCNCKLIHFMHHCTLVSRKEKYMFVKCMDWLKYFIRVVCISAWGPTSLLFATSCSLCKVNLFNLILSYLRWLGLLWTNFRQPLFEFWYNNH